MGYRVAVGLFGLVLAACNGDDSGDVCMYQGQLYRVGQSFPASDGCNSCSCTTSGVACTALACIPTDGGVDADPASCLPSNGCPVGPACGTVCCGPGERCNAGTCECGTGPACGGGDTCESAGPGGADGCGTICCGGSGPCPQ